MDPWWNPATEDQAVDRIHRLGQKRAVEVIRYIAKGSVESKIIELQNQKREMISVMIPTHLISSS
jgi:SWI/SNF-related matrix-associated actin-dependent regulator of chromatin subfamily A3